MGLLGQTIYAFQLQYVIPWCFPKRIYKFIFPPAVYDIPGAPNPGQYLVLDPYIFSPILGIFSVN